MPDFLIFQGVPRGIIEMETRSLSTRENALYAKQLLNAVPGRKQLMISDYHMFRIRQDCLLLAGAAIQSRITQIKVLELAEGFEPPTF
jgi:hypothetical protein